MTPTRRLSDIISDLVIDSCVIQFVLYNLLISCFTPRTPNTLTPNPHIQSPTTNPHIQPARWISTPNLWILIITLTPNPHAKNHHAEPPHRTLTPNPHAEPPHHNPLFTTLMPNPHTQPPCPHTRTPPHTELARQTICSHPPTSKPSHQNPHTQSSITPNPNAALFLKPCTNNLYAEPSCQTLTQPSLCTTPMPNPHAEPRTPNPDSTNPRAEPSTPNPHAEPSAPQPFLHNPHAEGQNPSHADPPHRKTSRQNPHAEPSRWTPTPHIAHRTPSLSHAHRTFAHPDRRTRKTNHPPLQRRGIDNNVRELAGENQRHRATH